MRPAHRRLTCHAGTANLKLVGKIVLGVVLPVSLLAIALAATFAYLFFKYKRRYAVSLLSTPLGALSYLSKVSLSELTTRVTAIRNRSLSMKLAAQYWPPEHTVITSAQAICAQDSG